MSDAPLRVRHVSTAGGDESADPRLDIALRAADIGIWEWDLDTNVMEYSNRARSLFGFTEGEVTLERVRAVTHPLDLPRTSEMARRAIDPQVRAREPYRFRAIREDDGALRWMLAHGEAVFAGEGGRPRAVRYIGTIQDITEEVEAAEALAGSEARLRLAIEAAGMAVWEFDGDTGKLTTSPELNRLFGFPEDSDHDIDTFRERYGPGERDKVQEAARAAMAEGHNQFQVEFRCDLPGKGLRWRLLRAQLDLNEDGSFRRVIGVLVDIDQAKRAEERHKLLLRELNHRVKNSLAIVQSLAGQTFRTDNARPQALEAFRNRLFALAKANDVLIDEDWSNFDLRSLVSEITQPYRDVNSDPFHIHGERQILSQHLTVPLAMALHELCTNAVKYGSLTVPQGRVDISWSEKEEGVIDFVWREIGGPLVVPPSSSGFGTRLLSDRLSPQLGGVEVTFAPSGLVCRMRLARSQPGA